MKSILRRVLFSDLFSECMSVVLLAAVATFAMAGLLNVATAAPAPVQGTGVGTLPRVERRVSWLTAHQTVEMQRGEAVLVISSTHDGEEDLAQGPPPSSPQVIESSWTWRGVTMTVKTPRWSNEMTDEGRERWEQRHATAMEAALRKWPRDAFVYWLPQVLPRELPPIQQCTGAREAA